MSTLNVGSDVILAVSGDWYREMARQGMLPVTADKGESELFGGKVLEETHEGMWIDLPENVSQVRVGNFFVPSRYVLTIIIGNIAERKKVGLRHNGDGRLDGRLHCSCHSEARAAFACSA